MFANIVLSAYIYEAKVFNDNALAIGSDECFANDSGGCFVVQTSEYATTFGIPNPLYGLVFFSIMFVIFLVFALVKNINIHLKTFLLSFTSMTMISGSVFSIWLLHVQFTLLKTVCIYCLWVDGLMILSAWMFFFFYGKNIIRTLFE